MADLSVVMDKLHGFESSEDLAEFFRGYGIKARPKNSRACAISQFVLEETGLFNILTDSRSVTHYRDERSTEICNKIPHTDAMAEFIGLYDTGCYPDLVEKNYPTPQSQVGSVWL